MALIEPKRIHEFTTASGGELASSPIWIEVEVPDGYGGFRNRKTPLPTSGTPSDVIQNVTASTGTTVVDLDLGNLVFVSVLTNTEIQLSNIAAGRKYTFVFTMITSSVKTVTFASADFNGAAITVAPVVLTDTLASGQFKVIDFIGTGGTDTVSERSRNELRRYTPIQTVITPASGDLDYDLGFDINGNLRQAFRATVGSATELQFPTFDTGSLPTDFATSYLIAVTFSADVDLTFVAGYFDGDTALPTLSGLNGEMYHLYCTLTQNNSRIDVNIVQQI